MATQLHSRTSTTPSALSSCHRAHTAAFADTLTARMQNQDAIRAIIIGGSSNFPQEKWAKLDLV